MQAIRLDLPFKLRVGEAATSSDIGRLELLAIRNDSRCPQDVKCVWAGDAALDLRLTPTQGEATNLALSVLVPSIDVDVSRTYELTLIELDPAPRSNASIDTADYRGTFKLTRKRDD